MRNSTILKRITVARSGTDGPDALRRGPFAGIDGVRVGKPDAPKLDGTAKARKKKVHAKIALRSTRKVGGLGVLDSARGNRVFQRRQAAFRACYECRLKVNASVSGKIVITFTLGLQGRITNIKVTSNSTGDSALGSCVIGKVRAGASRRRCAGRSRSARRSSSPGFDTRRRLG